MHQAHNAVLCCAELIYCKDPSYERPRFPLPPARREDPENAGEILGLAVPLPLQGARGGCHQAAGRRASGPRAGATAVPHGMPFKVEFWPAHACSA